MSYSKEKDLQGKVADKLNSIKDFNFKERFGTIPKSIMKFKKTEDLMNLIDWDNSEIGKIEGDAKARGGGFAKNLRYSIYNPDQAFFILDYYTEPNYLILDPFSGRVTRSLVSVYLNRNYIGYDTSLKTCELNNRILKEKFPEKNNYKIINGDGTELKEFRNKENCIDAVFTCPPYYDKEKYSGDKGDLSQLSYEEFDEKIKNLFKHLYRLIKKSNYENYEFYPVIFTVGTIRCGSKGIIDMDYLFQKFAFDAGFILHDKLFTENITPAAGFTFRRNFAYKYVTKNYETTLIFLKY